jgi:inward rectifier potassium channel
MDRRGGWLRHWREPYLLALAMSWPAFLASVALVYLAINLLFAGLYSLDPGGIGGATGEAVSFAEAFFFSVQTLGSIGYGVLHPVSLYAHLVVTAESLSGLLFIALTTVGLRAVFPQYGADSLLPPGRDSQLQRLANVGVSLG